MKFKAYACHHVNLKSVSWDKVLVFFSNFLSGFGIRACVLGKNSFVDGPMHVT